MENVPLILLGVFLKSWSVDFVFLKIQAKFYLKFYKDLNMIGECPASLRSSCFPIKDSSDIQILCAPFL